MEDFYCTIRDVHEKDLLHAGYKKTYEKVCSTYQKHLHVCTHLSLTLVIDTKHLLWDTTKCGEVYLSVQHMPSEATPTNY